MHRTRSELAWSWIGCTLPLIGGVLIIALAFWSLPTNDFTLKPLQLDPTNPLLGEWRVLTACDTPSLPWKVRFTAAGTWESLADPTFHGTYHFLDSDHVDIDIQGVRIRYALRVEAYALVLWQRTGHQTLVQDTIQFGECGGSD